MVLENDRDNMASNLSFIRVPLFSLLFRCHDVTLLTNYVSVLILFTDSLRVRFAIWVEEFLAALLPGGLRFRHCDVPIGPAFLDNCT